MKQVFTRLVLLMIACSITFSLAGASDTPEPPEPPFREVVWQAALRAVQQHGLSITLASFEEGRIVTGFIPLTAEAIAQHALLSDQDQHRQWGGGEYRYAVSLGNRSQGVRVAVAVEIQAWTPQSPAEPEARKQRLQSNQALEKEFLRAFTEALRQGATE